MAAKKSQLPPSRRQVWLAEPDFIAVGKEQREKRPVVVVSNDKYNKNKMELVIVLPITTTDFALPYHISIDPPEGGLKEKSFIMCDQIKCVSRKRLIEQWGFISRETMQDIETKMKIILDFDLP